MPREVPDHFDCFNVGLPMRRPERLEPLARLPVQRVRDVHAGVISLPGVSHDAGDHLDRRRDVLASSWSRPMLLRKTGEGTGAVRGWNGWLTLT
jgi:hypothetical protein